MDDDNSYDIQLFDEMRTTTRVSVWPVALSGQLLGKCNTHHLNKIENQMTNQTV